MVERRTWDAAPKNWAGNKVTARPEREQLEWLAQISTEHEHQLHALQSAEAEARHQRELLEWLADISTEHEHQLRNLQSAEAEARHQRELLEWMADISTEHEYQLRNLQLAEGKTSEAIEYRQWLADVSTVHEADWDPAKHPRRGASPNAGWFATTGGSGSSSKQASADSNRNGASPFSTVSQKSPKQSTPRSDAPTNAQPPESSRGQAPRSPANEKLNSDTLLTYFKLLYGDKGQKLLKAFEKSQGRVKVENPWLGANSALDTRSIGRPQQIRVREDLDPAQAARELMERLIEASGLTEVRQHLDHSGFDNIETLIASYQQSVKQAAAAVALASELYLSGISIVNEGADWVVTIHDLSEGNYYAAIGLLPLLPASVGRTGVLLKHGKETLRISPEVVKKIKALPVGELIELLESTRKLARNMEKADLTRPAGTAAHHIVPAGLNKYPSAKESRKILKNWGISVDNAANGVYLPSKFDDAIRAAYHGTLHTKAYFDEVFERLKTAKSAEEALLALNQIRKELLAGKFPR